MTENNHIARPEDFKALRDSIPAERVVLPKLGKAVLLARPTPMWFLVRGQLPSSLASRLQGGQAGLESVEDLRALADWLVPLLQEVFVQPKLSLSPSASEISPDVLSIEDASFIVRWAVGEIQGSGEGQGSVDDLRPFRGEPEPASPGAGGGNVVVPTK